MLPNHCCIKFLWCAVWVVHYRSYMHNSFSIWSEMRKCMEAPRPFRKLNRMNIFPTSQLMTHTCISDRLLCARECQTPTHTSTRRLSLSWSYCCNISFYEQAFLFQVLSEVWLRGATWQRNHLTVACSKANLCIAAYVRVHLILYNNWSLLFRWVLCGHGSPRGVAEWYVSHISLHGWQKMTVPYSYLYRKGFSDCKCTGSLVMNTTHIQ